ncbi:hypothetical protein TEA_029248 [Camellia sinensis var. sinensis]|uniref:Uncharacterized protein n=1 Tax=Camellia sinensis var. sinensis TaxID=542762 RepID=A0A4S4DN12_CAMSN|nr:hypothetical protein TEA_029248 [Camellia sinensis var. sinensis]
MQGQRLDLKQTWSSTLVLEESERSAGHVNRDGGGGLPRYYALIHSVVSKRPFKLVKTRFGLLMMMMMACHVWAAYDDDDGMPCYYALNHSVISNGPFQVGENRVWAAYDDDDGMPLYSALIHSAISKRPFKLPRNAQTSTLRFAADVDIVLQALLVSNLVDVDVGLLGN